MLSVKSQIWVHFCKIFLWKTYIKGKEASDNLEFSDSWFSLISYLLRNLTTISWMGCQLIVSFNYSSNAMNLYATFESPQVFLYSFFFYSPCMSSRGCSLISVTLILEQVLLLSESNSVTPLTWWICNIQHNIVFLPQKLIDSNIWTLISHVNLRNIRILNT